MCELGKYLRWLVLKLESLAKCPSAYLDLDSWSVVIFNDPMMRPPGRWSLSIGVIHSPLPHGMELSLPGKTQHAGSAWNGPIHWRGPRGVWVWPAKIETIRPYTDRTVGQRTSNQVRKIGGARFHESQKRLNFELISIRSKITLGESIIGLCSHWGLGS